MRVPALFLVTMATMAVALPTPPLEGLEDRVSDRRLSIESFDDSGR